MIRRNLVILFFVVLVSLVFVFYFIPSWYKPAKDRESIGKEDLLKEIKTFSSKEDFKLYLLNTSDKLYYLSELAPDAWGVFGARIGEGEAKDVAPERFSPTNVQVEGIDEPDIVKTDGRKIYFSDTNLHFSRFGVYITLGEKGTKIIKAFPPEGLEVRSNIDEAGNLLLYNNVLVVLSPGSITGYDVSNDRTPKKLWKIELKDAIVGSRLYKNKIYLVLSSLINSEEPCPVILGHLNEQPILVECSKIHHPSEFVPIDSVYTIMVLNPENGDVENLVSFVGLSYYSVVYMSTNAIYLTYVETIDYKNLYLDVIVEKCSDLFPPHVMDRLKALKNEKNISEESKMVIIEFINSLDYEERERIDLEIERRAEEYIKEKKRNIVKTNIIKVGLDMKLKSIGKVPGVPLNQFSMDEYLGYFRIATTVGTGLETANDVYVLDENLRLVGSVEDLGLGERIYSVRFIQDKGYVVTFRQIDPFYVLDLSNPTNPVVKGELKIPGFSSYLHPIEENKIIGIGMNESKVKISLFDVSSAENPIEVDNYILEEYWSDVLKTHHAFLLDNKHKIFFLPAGSNGYIFSYQNDKIELKKAIYGIGARRALYIDDYLYVIGDEKIEVFSELNWEKVGEIEL
ncbi:MAG: beta-propeller domain-containing protein [Candidatus Aenigmarchaeota archaeon]|nr:beta-propeller domain-containing protein [Candidatus Aenigmarchaeota archaeon]MDW8160094.1 beta-propeller domain-containing protein [Candidatus Aenigmarchaeota archaeon]